MNLPVEDISTSPDAILESNQAYARMGSSVSGAGDVNDDGFDDIIGEVIRDIHNAAKGLPPLPSQEKDE